MCEARAETTYRLEGNSSIIAFPEIDGWKEQRGSFCTPQFVLSTFTSKVSERNNGSLSPV